MRRLIALIALLVPSVALADGPVRFPVYLFGEWKYWLFILVYTLITVKIVQWTRQVADNRDQTRPLPMDNISLVAVAIFFNALIYQIFHHFEHLTQIFQWWFLQLTPPQAKGIIFFADLEWNHFIFDMGYFIMLFVATMILLRRWWQTGNRLGRMGVFLLIGMNLVQGWHAVEHTYRIVHHVQTGCEPCAGIADQMLGIPLIPLHFWFNVLALTMPLMVFFWFRMDRRLITAVRKALGMKVQETYSPAPKPMSVPNEVAQGRLAPA